MLLYARLRFRAQWLEEERRIRSPLHWRDDLEMALKKVACILPRQECGECFLLQKCIYTGLFKPDLRGVQGDWGGTQIPLPFSLLLPQQSNGSGKFELELTLLDPWVDRLPYWLFALNLMGKNKAHPFKIILGEEWTGKEWKAFYDGEQDALERAVLPRRPEPLVLKGVTKLRWIRPGRIFSLGRPQTKLSFRGLVEALCRRAKLLDKYYGKGEPLSFQGLLEMASKVASDSLGLRWVERHHCSRRQNTTVALSGLLGEMLLEGDLQPFGELLALGRDLGVGKGTALGLGRYEIISAEGQHM
ncbi:MAG: CRISPR system precrRNA processing endoribonuclease RAMP protein Cas6 [bacterium]